MVLFREPLFESTYEIEETWLHWTCRGQLVRLCPATRGAALGGCWRRSENEQAWSDCRIEVSLRDVESLAGKPLNAPRLMPSKRARLRAARFLAGEWPRAWRDLVRPFREAHWPLLWMLDQGGEAARELLASNPALGWLAAKELHQRVDLALLLAERRREIAAACGLPGTESVVRTLAKVKLAEVDAELLNRLRQSFSQPAERAVTHLGSINRAALKVATDPAWRSRWSPRAMASLARVQHPDLTRSIEQQLTLLEEESARTREPLPRVETLADLNAALGFRFRVENTAAPKTTPELPALAGLVIEPLLHRWQLKEESEEMHHCIGTEASYWRRIQCDNLRAFRVTSPWRLTFTISRRLVGHAREWHFVEVKGKFNAQPPREAMAQLERWLARYGEPDKAEGKSAS